MTLGTETTSTSTYAAAYVGPLVIPGVTSCLSNS
jgi:hypothetical protein